MRTDARARRPGDLETSSESLLRGFKPFWPPTSGRISINCYSTALPSGTKYCTHVYIKNEAFSSLPYGRKSLIVRGFPDFRGLPPISKLLKKCAADQRGSTFFRPKSPTPLPGRKFTIGLHSSQRATLLAVRTAACRTRPCRAQDAQSTLPVSVNGAVFAETVATKSPIAVPMLFFGAFPAGQPVECDECSTPVQRIPLHRPRWW